MDRISEIITGPEANDLRLDVFLAKRFNYHSRSEWQKAVQEGEILLNGRKTKASRLLHSGEKIAFVPKEPLPEPPVDTNYQILERTPHYIAVNKPGNLPCHPSGIFFKHTLWYLMKEDLGCDLHIITRLDRETSGVVLAALDSETASRMTQDMMAGKIEKRYYSIVHGNFEKEIHAKGYLSNDPGAVVHKKRRFTVQEVPESESSETLLLPVAGDGTFSLVEARPRTGRLHQIRATLCSLGYPLAGDKLYGTDETFFLRFIEDALTEEDRASLRLPGQALHAAELIWNGIHFRAPVPDEWKEKFPELFKIMNLSESLMSRK